MRQRYPGAVGAFQHFNDDGIATQAEGGQPGIAEVETEYGVRHVQPGGGEGLEATHLITGEREGGGIHGVGDGHGVELTEQ